MYEIINQRLKSRDPSIAVALYSVHTHCILYILNHGLICFLANSNWQSFSDISRSSHERAPNSSNL